MVPSYAYNGVVIYIQKLYTFCIHFKYYESLYTFFFFIYLKLKNSFIV